jgi:putative FmdB family regulatory protein
MPIYEYQCRSCGHAYEALQKFSEAPLTECPACHKPDLAKKISASGFRLKGAGWYETDFKSGSKKNVAGDTASPASASSSSSTTTATASSVPAASSTNSSD